jgi:YidC/Oxa1 family membrane protein insertase
MMLIIMPIMFGFIFYNMPSGLVLYWVVNTVLTVVEQAGILRKE